MGAGTGRSNGEAWLCRSLQAGWLIAGYGIAQAQPIPLPYRSREPFLPVIELFGGPRRGLVLAAEEADSGRPAPLSIGNTTFYPQVRRAGALYGGYTSIKGDLQIQEGDLFLNNWAVGASLDQHEHQLNLLSTQTGQLQQRITLQQQGLDHVNQSVDELGQMATQQAATMTEHGQAIQTMAVDLGRAQQDIARLEQSMTNLGQGMAGATALAAALASLPNDPGSAPLTCGIGSVGYSDRYALAMGCSVSLNTALSIQAGGAYLFGGGRSYGTGSLSSLAGSLGLSYRFGAANNSGRVASQRQPAIEQELHSIKAENRELRLLIQAMNQRLNDQQGTAQLTGMR
jgi:hypothetical protein